jgi:hypothetical protein
MPLTFTFNKLVRSFRQAGFSKLFANENLQSLNRSRMELIHNSLVENQQLIRRIDERFARIEQ